MGRKRLNNDLKKCVPISISIPLHTKAKLDDLIPNNLSRSKLMMGWINDFIREKDNEQTKIYDPKALFYCSACDTYMKRNKSRLWHKSHYEKDVKFHCFNAHCGNFDCVLIGIDGEDFFDLKEWEKENQIEWS